MVGNRTVDPCQDTVLLDNLRGISTIGFFLTGREEQRKREKDRALAQRVCEQLAREMVGHLLRRTAVENGN